MCDTRVVLSFPFFKTTRLLIWKYHIVIMQVKCTVPTLVFYINMDSCPSWALLPWTWCSLWLRRSELWFPPPVRTVRDQSSALWQVEEICTVSDITVFIIRHKHIAVLSRNPVTPNRFPPLRRVFIGFPKDISHEDSCPMILHRKQTCGFHGTRLWTVIVRNQIYLYSFLHAGCAAFTVLSSLYKALTVWFIESFEGFFWNVPLFGLLVWN